MSTLTYGSTPPAGVTDFRIADRPCDVCWRSDFTLGPDDTSHLMTYSAESVDGRHRVRMHHEWCPAVTTEPPAYPAPCCGARVDAYDFEPSVDRRRAPHRDRVTFAPCGHSVTGEDAHAAIDALAQIRIKAMAAEAERVFAQHADLIADVERAGHGRVVAMWKLAVQRQSSEEAGLLAAMRALATKAA